MKKIVAILAVFLLVGCGGRTAIDTAHMNIQASVETQNKTIDVLQQKLPKECQTAEIMALLERLRTTNQNILASAKSLAYMCDEEIETLNTKVKNRDLIIAGLVILLFLIVHGRVISLFKGR